MVPADQDLACILQAAQPGHSEKSADRASGQLSHPQQPQELRDHFVRMLAALVDIALDLSA